MNAEDRRIRQEINAHNKEAKKYLANISWATFEPKRRQKYDVFLNGERMPDEDIYLADSRIGLVVLYETDGAERIGNAPRRVIDHERHCIKMKELRGEVVIKERE